MKRWADYAQSHSVAPVAVGALARGGFTRIERGPWTHGRRRFAHVTINKLISDGLARRIGDRVVKP